MATISSKAVPISHLQTVIALAQARGFTTICISTDSGDIVVGKDTGDIGKPRELEGDSFNSNGTDINLN